MSVYSFLITDSAALDFDESYRWYAERSLDSADNFEQALYERIDSICQQPTRFPMSLHSFREASLKDFPFRIVYLVDDEAALVIITAIYHYRRNPENKFRDL